MQNDSLPPVNAASVEVVPWDSTWDAAWDRYVIAHRDGTFFHSLAWRDAVQDCFPHQAHYIIAIAANRIVGLLPLFFVRSRLAGRVLLSVPYATAGGILADSRQIALALHREAGRIAGRLRCRGIEFRSARAQVPGIPILNRYVGFTRALPAVVDEEWRWLPRKARAEARRARDRFGLEVAFEDSLIGEVWDLYARNMRRLGSINYPRMFFKQLLARTPDAHWTTIVTRNGREVAGLLTFLFRDRVLPYFFGCTAEARECGAANFLYARVMEEAIRQGFRFFDFGRSRRDNVGSVDFKRLQGFEPTPLDYQYVALRGGVPNLTPSRPLLRGAAAVWKRLPLALTRPLGARLARHLPG
jgi:FemAB-related protein (PEP-CTERM system-associated)